MTIHGIGVDLLHVPRMATLVRRRGTNRVASRILSPLERDAFRQSLDGRGSNAATVVQFLGVRWAAKEAAYKALYPLRPTWKALTYTTFDPRTGAKPTLVLHPNSEDAGLRLHVSVSHDGEYILAYVVAEQRDYHHQ